MMGDARLSDVRADLSPAAFEARVDMFAGPSEATDLAGAHLLKHGNVFMLSDDAGDVVRRRNGLGLYDGDTRMLSTYVLRFNDGRPGVLLAAPRASAQATIWLTNPDRRELPRQTLGIERQRQIDDAFVERITVRNFSQAHVPLRLTLRLGADFADIFEVRGMTRNRVGSHRPIMHDGERVTFTYLGTDGRTYQTLVELQPAWQVLDADDRGVTMGQFWRLEPASVRTIDVRVATAVRGDDGDGLASRASIGAAHADYEAWRATTARVATSHVPTTTALERALDDVRLLQNIGPGGDPYTAAGLPWYSCLFGRDSLITGLQLLPIAPSVARDSLTALAVLQADAFDEWRDAQPGKIPHELRTGELARANEIPFTPYYGTVDATPLWLMVLDEYHRWTADDALVARLWPNALAALEWIERHGDSDGDGFVEYRRVSDRGLDNQGWKDSWDALRMRDGRLAEAPIALVEVQAYAYAARRSIARLASLRGEIELAERVSAAAERLREQFEAAFWMPDAGTYAFALDGHKRQVDAIASNAGHALWTGICSPDRAASTARVLTTPDMWSGWGIRTLATTTGGYNPIGYHSGSIWPHDNAIIAAGFERYGLSRAAALVAGGLFEATAAFPEARLPELFSGYGRDVAPTPVPYPVACSPQAWAAGALFHLVTAMLGLRPDASAGRLEVRPDLPDWLPDLAIDRLRVGGSVLDISVRRGGRRFEVDVTHRSGKLDVVVGGDQAA
jgi:glycogen debranching enzyme